ncbi:MAG TPA: glycosyltransferase [Candidatus Acidoferrum sp.]
MIQRIVRNQAFRVSAEALRPNRMQTAIALLGQKDQPTDAVEDYCLYLAAALLPHGIQLDIRRVPWEIHGWDAALETLPLMATRWRNTWVLVQYTALAWSARGFPQKFLRVLDILKTSGARVAVIFHDVLPYPGTRLVDRFRRFTQTRVMRRAVTQAEAAIFTVSPEKASWLPNQLGNVVFIPVGANLPIPQDTPTSSAQRDMPEIAVFGITGGEPGNRETAAIVSSVRNAAQSLGPLKLNVFGRGANQHENALHQAFEGLPITLSVEGILTPESVVERLLASDVLLFVRGPISSRRGSAIAGISCGLPVVGHWGPETASTITEAGVILVPENDSSALSDALLRVLSDQDYRQELRARSCAAYKNHFSWSAIASQFHDILEPTTRPRFSG